MQRTNVLQSQIYSLKECIRAEFIKHELHKPKNRGYQKRKRMIFVIKIRSVGGRSGEGGSRKTNALVCRVEHGIEALEPCESVDEVKTLTGWCAEVANNQIHVIGGAANSCIESTRPRLSIGSELESNLKIRDQNEEIDRRH